MDLSKYIKSDYVEVSRSTINIADYNPRELPEEARKQLKKSIKKFGMVGGLVINKQTGNTLVGGHQRLSVMDELQKYDPQDESTDYKVRVEVIDVDDKTEKELCISLNNPNSQGVWNYDKLRELIPDIDYKDAGLTKADLSMIGVDYILKTDEENDLADALASLRQPIVDEREDLKAERQAEREAKREESEQVRAQIQQAQEEAEAIARKEHMMEVKKEVKEKATGDAKDMDAYIMLSFDTFEKKAEFCEQFGYDPYLKFIKGEDFQSRIDGFEEEE